MRGGFFISLAFHLLWHQRVLSYSTDDSDSTIQDIVYESGNIWNGVFLHDPPVHEVQMNEVVELHLMFSKHFVTGNWQGTRENLAFPITSRRYDNLNPGKTFAIKRGTKFKLHLFNELEGSFGPNTKDVTCEAHIVDLISYQCMNHTNLHWHGLTLDPRGIHDDVSHVDLAPGQNFTYAVDVMEDHSTGIFWYHPHRHGSAALQVTSGAYGAAVILNEITEDTTIDLARFIEFPVHTIFLSYHYLELYEYTHLLQSKGADTREVDLYNKQISKIFNYTGNPYVTLTNGAFRPGIEIIEKTYYRWQIIMAPVIFINVTFFPLWDFGANCTVHVVARDGVYYDAPEQIFDNAPELFSSGNRLEIVVYCESVPELDDYIWDIAGNTIYDESDYLVAFFLPVFKKCEDGVCDSDKTWEGTLPRRPEHLTIAETFDFTQLTARRVTWDFNYRHMGDEPHYPNFWWSINKQAYNPSTSLPNEETQVNSPEIPLNSYEIWRIEDWENLGHVFHLHTNRFMVLDYYIANQHDVDLGRSWDQVVGRWMDNVMVPLGNDYCHTGVEDHYVFDPKGLDNADNSTCIPGYIEILVHFYKYPGQRVFHCHFLNHEDHGMMSVLTVCDRENSCSAKEITSDDLAHSVTTLFTSGPGVENEVFAFGIVVGASVIFGIVLFYYFCCGSKRCASKRVCSDCCETPYAEVSHP